MCCPCSIRFPRPAFRSVFGAPVECLFSLLLISSSLSDCAGKQQHRFDRGITLSHHLEGFELSIRKDSAAMRWSRWLVQPLPQLPDIDDQPTEAPGSSIEVSRGQKDGVRIQLPSNPRRLPSGGRPTPSAWPVPMGSCFLAIHQSNLSFTTSIAPSISLSCRLDQS